MDSPLICTTCLKEKPISDFNKCTAAAIRGNRCYTCKVCVSAKNLAYRTANRDKILAYMKKRWIDGGSEIRAQKRVVNNKINEKARQVIWERYGRVCACCGESDEEFLTLDHINGDGAKERRGLGWNGKGVNFYRWLMRNGLPDGFRTLCFNCNSACGTHGHCPHMDFDENRLIGACG